MDDFDQKIRSEVLFVDCRIGHIQFIHFENFTSVTDDKLLIAIFGGLFLWAGIGITIKTGAVLVNRKKYLRYIEQTR